MKGAQIKTLNHEQDKPVEVRKTGHPQSGEREEQAEPRHGVKNKTNGIYRDLQLGNLITWRHRTCQGGRLRGGQVSLSN